MPPALGLGPTLTPLSALQFSSLREEKKQQGIMGLIEKENLILRQVMARAPLRPGLGYRPVGWGTMMDKIRLENLHSGAGPLNPLGSPGNGWAGWQEPEALCLIFWEDAVRIAQEQLWLHS